MTLIVAICAFVIYIIGFMLCCVPALFTLPVFFMTFVVIYRDLYLAKPKTNLASDVFFEPV
jgi:hypothetical protein